MGLGNVILDNVKVLGRIIVAGGGEGESGEASVLLNNVTAHQMVVDPATGQYVSIRALGNTDISETLVRSDAYIQDDVRNNNMGLRKVIFEEPAEGHFTIAGNMKDVTVKAPGSLLTVGDTGTGSVTKITVDEEATDARLNLEINASVDDIKLDTSSTITGTGVELAGARQLMVIAARAAGIQCFDTVYTNLEDTEGFRRGLGLPRLQKEHAFCSPDCCGNRCKSCYGTWLENSRGICKGTGFRAGSCYPCAPSRRAGSKYDQGCYADSP